MRSLAVCAAFASLPRPLRLFQNVLALASRTLAKPMREGARFDVRAQVPTLEPPLLVMCGARDRANIPLSRRLAALVPQANFELVPSAGHVANVDNPDGFNRLLRAFLRSAERSPRTHGYRSRAD